MRSIAVLLFLLPAADGAQAQEGPSFNCRFAGTATEQAICASPRLARIERWVVSSFDSLADRLGRREARALADVQLALRQACEGEPACIEERLIATAEAFEASGAAPLPFPFPDLPEPPVAVEAPSLEAPSLEDRLALGPPLEAEATDALPASQADAEPASGDGSPAALPGAFDGLPAYRRANVQGRLAEAGYRGLEPSGAWDVATMAALAAVAREVVQHGRGQPFDPSTATGAAALLDFVESDAFRRAFLGG